MKRVNLVLCALLVFIFSSCSKSPEEKAILKYEQTIEGVFTDMSMKINNLEKIDVVTANDSALFYQNLFETESVELIEAERFVANSFQGTVDFYKEMLNTGYVSAEGKKDFKKTLKETLEALEKTQLRVKQFENGDFRGTYCEKIVQKADGFESRENEVIATVYKCTYTIKNSLLNNVKQTIVKKYIVSDSDMKVVFSEQIKS